MVKLGNLLQPLQYMLTTTWHISTYESSEDEAINLVECDHVSVEVKKDKVGVKYVKDGVEGLTPVVKRRKKKSC